jgi:hypothetical protein
MDTLAAALMSNRVISSVEFQDCRLNDGAILINFCKSLLNRGASLTIPISRLDIEEMYRNMTLTAESHQELNELVAKLKAGNPAISIPREAIEPPELPPAPSEVDLDAPFPEGENVAVQKPDEECDPAEWIVNIDPIPAVDNDAFFEGFLKENSIAVLLSRIK